MFAVYLFRSITTVSPVLNQAKPPPVALSGEALRIEGLPDVPDCLPSPIQGSSVIPLLIKSSEGCILTTSAEPGHPTGPAPLMTSIEFSSIIKLLSFNLS